MDQHTKQKLIQHLSAFTTTNKVAKMQQVLQSRTRHVAVVVEDIFQPHNMSAAIRSAECFGVQDFHIIEQRHSFVPDVNVSRGASNWVTLHQYREKEVNNVATCFATLRKQGYRIVATSPHAKSCNIADLPIDSKFALVFGTEETGISDYVKENADASVVIPMYGFTESFNISVSVALCLYDVTTRLRSSDSAWQLSEQDRVDIELAWLRSVVSGASELEKRYLAK